MNQIDAPPNSVCGDSKTISQPAAGKQSDISAEKKVSEERVDKVTISEAVKNINAALTSLKREERQFSTDEDLGRLVVKIINADTKELIRQIPSEEALALSKKMQETIRLLFD